MLLHTLATLANQMANMDETLKYLVKAAEMLEDLHSTFYVGDLNSDHRSAIELLEISNRLSK